MGLAIRTVFGTLLCAFFLGALILQKNAHTTFNKIQQTSEQYYLPSSAWLKIFSCGYNEALASTIWIKFVLYYSTSPKQYSQTPPTPYPNEEKTASHPENPIFFDVDYIQAVTSLDPHFHSAYENGARLTLYHRGNITKDTVEMSIRILEKGMRYFPSDGQLMFNLGFLYYYELPVFATDPAEKRTAKRKGAQIIQRAAQMDNAPKYVSMLATNLLEKEGMEELVVEHLKYLLTKESSPDIRRNLESQLFNALRDQEQMDLKKLNRLHSQWYKSFNYISFELYLLLLGEPDTIALTAEMP